MGFGDGLAAGEGPSGADLGARLREDLGRLTRPLRELPPGAGSLHRIRMSVAERADPGLARLDLYGYLELVRVHAERHGAQLMRLRRAAAEA